MVIRNQNNSETSNGRENSNAMATIASLSVNDPKVVPQYLVDAQHAIENVIKLDENCISLSMESIDRAIADLEKSDSVGGPPFSASETVSQISKVTKSLHGGVSKLSKLIDSNCHSIEMDLKVLDTVLPNMEGKDAGINELIVEHFYSSGDFQAGDIMAQEAGIEHWETIKQPYIRLFDIEKELKEHRLDVALAWVDENTETLKHNVQYVENRLPFLLHRLYFLQIFEARGPYQAIQYAREHMQKFYTTHALQLHQLLGGVAFFRPGLTMDVHPDIVSRRYGTIYSSQDQVLWDEVRAEFRRQFCYVINKPQESPLLVSVSAGSFVLPTLLKYSKVAAMGRSTSSFAQGIDHLPVELPLPDEFAFHSTFTCPVSKESNNESDPALMLPCGHCLNKTSVLKLAKGTARNFKCPYCPGEAVFSDCKELHLV